jgi:hypothetical protein
MLITEAAVTVAAQLTSFARLTPTLTPTLTAPATSTPVQVAATVEAPPVVVPAPTNTVKPASTAAESPDAGSFVEDITIPDGTAAVPGAVFDKIWRVKNTGTSTWSSAYTLAWIDGDKMGAAESVPLPNEVRPGETVDISVKLTAPAKAGTYQTYFRLRNTSGQFFKLDGGGDLWVKIIVGLQATNTPGSETITPTLTQTTAP